MANTSLPTSVTGGGAGHVAHHNTIHAEINALSRDTGWRVLDLSNGWAVASGGFVRVRRVQETVYWQFSYLNGSAATGQIATLSGNPPAGSSQVSRGLAPRRNTRYSFRTGAGDDIQIVFSNAAVYVSPAAALTGALDTFEVVASADADWPTVLPPAQ